MLVNVLGRMRLLFIRKLKNNILHVFQPSLKRCISDPVDEHVTLLYF